MAEVVKMPDLLERLAKRLTATLAKDSKVRSEWVETKLEQAEVLATAKGQFPNTKKFGEWLNANGFGDNIIPHEARAALIDFGTDLHRARMILERTESWSVRLVHKNEWNGRLSSAAKSPSRGPRMAAGKAFVQAYEAERGKLPSEDEIAEGANTSRSTAHTISVAFKSRRNDELNPVKFTKAQDAHCEARIKAGVKAKMKEMESEFSARVVAENKRQIDILFPNLEKMQNEAERQKELYETIINNHKPVFTETEFNDIRFCLHPDNSASTERRAHAFKTFNLMKLQLTGKK